MMIEETLTALEVRAIKALQRLSKTWPDTLWLFSAASLHVMKRDKNGGHAVLPSGSMDPDYIVATIHEIDADGGDW